MRRITILASTAALSALAACKAQDQAPPQKSAQTNQYQSNNGNNTQSQTQTQTQTQTDSKSDTSSNTNTDVTRDSPVEPTSVRPKGFLSSSQIKFPDDPDALDDAAVKAILKGSSIFIANTPDEAVDNESCARKALKNVKMIGEKGSLKVQGELDLTDCSTDTIKFKTYRYRFLEHLSCENGDFTKYDGKLIANYVRFAFNKLCKSGRGYFLINNQSIYTYTTGSGATASSADVSAYESTSTVDNKPCQFTVADGVRTVDDGCGEFHTERAQTRVNGQSDVITHKNVQALWHGIEADDNWTYYVGGTMSLSVNDWKGSVSYSGVDKTPTYKLKKSGHSLEEKATPD